MQNLVALYTEHGMGQEVYLAAALFVASVSVSTALSLHVLTRRRQGAAVSWLALIWMAPLLGWISYTLLGVNRVQRKALRLRDHVPDAVGPTLPPNSAVPARLSHVLRLARAVGGITGHPVLAGNRVEPLRNGDAAYPAMLQAITDAQTSVTLLTYILDDDPWGNQFVDALIAAHQRGVAVRVLIDGIGARRAWGITKRLRRAGVPVASFLWSYKPWEMALVNLRNHRKLLVADGRVGFTGGMNIREAYVHAGRDPTAVACDVHYRIEGPVVRELQRQFALDWGFETGESIDGPQWFPELEPAGDSIARVIPDGPDEDLQKMASVLFQAVTLATTEVLIVTPYFLPDEALSAALEAAALRGVMVEVILPENNEPRFMNGVTIEDVRGSVARGMRLGFKQGPFEHTKLAVVDRVWTLLGSSNWDPRSLRLNFELNVEVYDPEVAEATLAMLDEVRQATRWVTLADIDARSTFATVRSRFLRLFKPYL